MNNTFQLQPEGFDATGTYNINHYLTEHTQSLLLPDGRAEFFNTIEETQIHDMGDPTCDMYGYDDKGYGNEWYFKAPSGNIVAIGFRWGMPRLRGDSRTTVADVVAFIDFLESQLSET